jgi:hypothetical protein
VSWSEFERFDAAMDKLLKADPAQVKNAMEQEKKQRAEERMKRKAKE